MANTTIQIKRSTSTATPGSLANGELAFTDAGNILYIGSASTVVPIAGKRFPGILTANQSLVANATSGIDKIITANLVPTNVWANGAAGSAGQVLTANATGGVYWASTGAGTAAGSDTQVQFNDGGSAFGGDAGLTYNKTTDVLSVANVVSVGNTVNVGSNLTVNTSTLVIIANSITNTIINATSIGLTNGSVNFTANSSGIWHNAGQVNAASYTVGTAFTANSTLVNTAAINVVNQVNTATLYATTSANVGTAFTANSSLVNAIALNVVNQVNTATFYATTSANVGTAFTANSSLVNAIALNVVNQVNTATIFITTSANIASSNVVVNTAGVFVANSSGVVNAFAHTVGTTFVANSTQVTVGVVGTNAVYANTTTLNIGNNSVNSTINSSSFNLGTAFTANTTLVNAAAINVVNQVNTATFFATTSATVGTIGVGNGVFVNTTAITLGNNSVNATINSTIYTGSANNTSYISGVAAANFVQNTDSRTLSGNLVFTGANVTFSGANHTITSTNTYISGNVAIAGANITATGATLSIKDIIATGNLTVQGTLTTIDTTNIQVKDATLKLADQNTTTDTIDFGFYGQSGNSTATYYSGLVRDHNLGTVANAVYTLFSTATEPAQTVDNTAPTYSLSTLRSYLSTSGLTTNSSTLAITATGSINVAIVANTLTLSTALGVASGGSGRATLTNNAVLIGNTVGAIGQVSSSTEGHVLQVSSAGIPTFSMLDGGTF